MAKDALLDVLQQTIGKYVKDLDPNKLNLAIWKGKIELKTLELDVESINSMLDKKAKEAPNLAIPFKVVSGHFELFEVVVPWNKITSKSVILQARGLSVVVEPLDRGSPQAFDDDEMAESDVDKNSKRVARQHELRKEQIEESDKYRVQAYALKKIALKPEENEENKSTFAQRLAYKIIQNIQIEISEVHISLRSADGAMGVVLNSVKLVTTNSEGKPVYVNETEADRRNSSLSDVDTSFQYKMLQIQGFGIYLDEDDFENARKSLQSIYEDSTSIISDNSSISSARTQLHTYILAPLDFETKLRIADSKVCAEYSMYQLRSNLSMLSFRLTRNQVDFVRKLAKIMSPSILGPTILFPEYRPVVPVKGHAREWWKYAGRCIGRINGRRLWVEFFEAFTKRRKYIPLYKRHKHHKECPWVKPLTDDEANDLVLLEQDRSISIEGLMTWRNIADGQIDKEREKRPSRDQKASDSYFSFVFGSSQPSGTEAKQMIDDEEPPIVLSVEEMKELEGVSVLDIFGKDMAKDWSYCDVTFVLDAMKIDLVGYDLKHVALLDMGKVTIDFETSMDGAFKTSFDLYDLEVFDRTTPDSLFASVLKKIESDTESNMSEAIHLEVTKSPIGDQSVDLKMVGFQLVASKLMAQELQKFFQDSSNGSASMKVKSNPLLRQSMTGSIDIFYDASQGDSFRAPQNFEEATDDTKTKMTPEATEILSNKLIDAWKKKSQSEVSWMLDLYVIAPVVIIPEACNDPRANVMVFDLGKLAVKYGKGDPTPEIKRWFDKYPRESLNDKKFEAGTINVKHLTFSVQKANCLQPIHPYQENEAPIIDPISISIDFAIEDIGPNFEPRSCFVGVIPTISSKISPFQGSQVLGVVNSWTDMFSGGEDDDQIQRPTVPTTSPESKVLTNTPLSVPIASVPEGESVSSGEESRAMFYCRIGLQHLEVAIVDKGQTQLEAHLVSVYASMLQCSDESSEIKLTMGWFWILDWITSSYVRNQRLVIHSNLPCSAKSFVERNNYNVVEELNKKGVFKLDYSGSTELADVTFKTLPRKINRSEDANIYQIHGQSISAKEIQYVLDVKFRSLVVHWNPHAIKEINALSNRFLEIFVNDDSAKEDGALILSPGDYEDSLKSERNKNVSRKEDIEGSDPLLIIAEMESLGIILNSARDDLPLFTLTVSNTRVSIIPRSVGQEISLSLGDLQIATPEQAGKTLPVYRTLLGIEDGSLGSLLEIKYCEGREAIESLNLESPGMENFEAIAGIELSPMRFCYIQSQVLTLVNYITEGVLGALTAKAAVSAAEAAKELGNSVSGNSFYFIRATSFQAVVPEAAYREERMCLKTTSLNVDYRMFSDARGSDIRAALANFMVTGNHQKELQEAPIYLSIDVNMPQVGIGSLDDQAMKVLANIPEAKFVLTRNQYSQMMNTLEKNFSETALFLRKDDWSGQIITSAKETHSGVQLDESTQRIRFKLNIGEFSLELNDRSREDPIVRLTATETAISINMIPDLEKFSMEALLKNLVCEDRRLLSRPRHSRYLINRSNQDGNVRHTDFFQIEYSQEANKTNIDLKLGSPQVVLIPDLILEILLFFGETKGEDGVESQAPPTISQDEVSSLNERLAQVDSSDNDVVLEANLRRSRTYTTTMSAKTGTCRFILIDLGTQYTMSGTATNRPLSSNSKAQLSEAVVTQGIFAATLSMESDIDSGATIASTFEFNSDEMEIFTAFGRELKSPLQILEPAFASACGSLNTITGDTEIEIRASALTPIHFSLSTHNAALLLAIVESVNDSIKHFEEKSTSIEAKEPSASAQKDKKNLDNYLDSRTSSSRRLQEAVTSERNTASITTKIKVNLTMPEATVTIINDLQGFDEALFRISVKEFVAGGQYQSPKTFFDFKCNTSIVADYFDSSVNLWNMLLIEPWKIDIIAERKHSENYKPRAISTFYLESFPCHVSFSEQFLLSLASTTRMWKMYSAATNGSSDQDGDNSNTTATAAARNRNLLSFLPNAIANHSGIDVSFSLESGSIKHRQCPKECVKYFRFDPPKGHGYGGTRVYGQDVKVPKIVQIEAAGSVAMVNMDLELNLPPRGHKVGNKLVLFTRVAKEGETTVLHLKSHVEVVNRTLIPFQIDFLYDKETSSDETENYRNVVSSSVIHAVSTATSLPHNRGNGRIQKNEAIYD
ncbi:unnamed protein product [Pseudo-nitzschia multistriata]|uniref:Chorein N-terminal domain-containing protein n=1 Tax=Pseudo-nitzschia multistriata TaxID=183589 RepID=A0A448ZMW5_9STRA|nr:unnamed protein product [Pseudo-nitzschia multistriata]